MKKNKEYEINRHAERKKIKIERRVEASEAKNVNKYLKNEV